MFGMDNYDCNQLQREGMCETPSSLARKLLVCIMLRVCTLDKVFQLETDNQNSIKYSNDNLNQHAFLFVLGIFQYLKKTFHKI